MDWEGGKKGGRQLPDNRGGGGMYKVYLNTPWLMTKVGVI